MYITISSAFALVLALSSTAEASAIKRAPTYIGWHWTTKESAEKMQASNTLLFLGNGQSNNQIGNGVYLAEKYDQWNKDVVCLFAADTAKLTAAEKVKYPTKNRQGKNIQWQFNIDAKAPFNRFSTAYFKDVGADAKKALRVSKWDNGIQLVVPEGMATESNPLGITIVECMPAADKEKLKNKNVVVNFKTLPGVYKGWMDGETPPAEACALNARAGTTPKKGCSASPTPTKSAPTTLATSTKPASSKATSQATSKATSKASATSKAATTSKPAATSKPAVTSKAQPTSQATATSKAKSTDKPKATTKATKPKTKKPKKPKRTVQPVA